MEHRLLPGVRLPLVMQSRGQSEILHQRLWKAGAAPEVQRPGSHAFEVCVEEHLNRCGVRIIFVGERGLLVHETYGDNPQLFPEGLREEAAAVTQTYARIEDTHEMNWADACKGIGEATSPFSYAAPLTEVMLLGLVALRAGQGHRIEYDAANMRVTNPEEANRYLTREYREGWSL